MADEDPVAGRLPLAADGRVDRVEQLADGHRRRPAQVRALVVAGVGDDQPLGRRHQRVEQHLAILGARVPVADVRVLEHQIVAVAAGLARKFAVVEAEHAHHAVRHRAHRHEGADGEVPGAEVRPRGAAAQPVAEERADVGQLQDRPARRATLARVLDDVVEQPLELAPLPGIALARVGERIRCVCDRSHPVGDRLGITELIDRRAGAVDELGEPPGELDRAAVDVIEWEHAGDEAPVLLAHRDADEKPVEPAAPGVGLEPIELERRSVRGIESPPDPARVDPVLHPRQVVVIESEAVAHGRGRREVEQLRRGRALVGERQQLTDDSQHRVGLAQRTVREPDAQVGEPLWAGAGVVDFVVVSGAAAAGAECCLDQRRERLDVRAHDDHVARLERGVVLEQMKDRVAQHLDLTGASVARVDLDAPVLGVKQRARLGLARWRRTRWPAVVADVALDCSSNVRVPVAGSGSWWSIASPARASTSWSSRESRPHDASSRLAGSVAVRSSTRWMIGPPVASVSSRRRHSAGDGCRTNRWTSRRSEIAASTSR